MAYSLFHLRNLRFLRLLCWLMHSLDLCVLLNLSSLNLLFNSSDLSYWNLSKSLSLHFLYTCLFLTFSHHSILVSGWFLYCFWRYFVFNSSCFLTIFWPLSLFLIIQPIMKISLMMKDVLKNLSLVSRYFSLLNLPFL